MWFCIVDFEWPCIRQQRESTRCIPSHARSIHRFEGEGEAGKRERRTV